MLVGNVNIIAGNESDLPAVLVALEREGVATRGNPDLYVCAYRSFGIDDAQDVRERAAGRAFTGRRVFVLAAHAMTLEAQNALLKTLEEAPGNALFVLLHPSPETLLATIRSRAQVVRLPRVGQQISRKVDVERFLKAAPPARLKLLEPLLEREADDSRDIGAIIGFLADLERALEKSPARLPPVYRARRFIADRGALVKPLLEQVALLV